MLWQRNARCDTPMAGNLAIASEITYTHICSLIQQESTYRYIFKNLKIICAQSIHVINYLWNTKKNLKKARCFSGPIGRGFCRPLHSFSKPVVSGWWLNHDLCAHAPLATIPLSINVIFSQRHGYVALHKSAYSGRSIKVSISMRTNTVRWGSVSFSPMKSIQVSRE